MHGYAPEECYVQIQIPYHCGRTQTDQTFWLHLICSNRVVGQAQFLGENAADTTMSTAAKSSTISGMTNFSVYGLSGSQGMDRDDYQTLPGQKLECMDTEQFDQQRQKKAHARHAQHHVYGTSEFPLSYEVVFASLLRIRARNYAQGALRSGDSHCARCTFSKVHQSICLFSLCEWAAEQREQCRYWTTCNLKLNTTTKRIIADIATTDLELPVTGPICRPVITIWLDYCTLIYFLSHWWRPLGFRRKIITFPSTWVVKLYCPISKKPLI